MHTDDPSLQLRSRSRRVLAPVLALVVTAALGGLAWVVFGLATAQPGASACNRLDELEADRVVTRLERSVASRVVRMKLTDGVERASVSGCPAAMSTLASVMSHKQFTKLVDCIATATTESAAARCI